MSAKAVREPRTGSPTAARVEAPPAESRTRQRLPPAFALAWLHLLPESAFPIRSRDDLAAKISGLLLAGGAGADAEGRSLPAAAGSRRAARKGAR